MKKIFAIALALVVVLSMASAFATTCPTINWDCATYTCATGKGSVEVIPYVKGNACGGDGFAYTPNTCAGAVNSEKVYFAVKVTVDADPSEDWWKEAKLTFSLKGMLKYAIAGITIPGTTIAEPELYNAIVNENDGELKAGEYYLVWDGGWAVDKAADYEAGVNSLFTCSVNNASIAKACVKLTSKTVLDKTNAVEINGYDVLYQANKAGTSDWTLKIVKGAKYVEVYLNADEKIDKFVVNTGAGNKEVKTYNADKTAFWIGADLSFTCSDEGKFLKAVMEAFKFDFGTCITDKAVKANFTWEDKVEKCFSWSDDVQAVVDAECVVAIPKTGDMSVLAWLF